MPTIFVPGGHVVTLVLVEVKDSSFYLRIPSRIINALCLKSRKYLLYLGWCILGVEGYLTHTRNGRKLNTEGNLEDRGVYYYAAVSPDLIHSVDLEVIKAQTTVSSETTHSSDVGFRTDLQNGEGYCAWTGIPYGTGLHIIPHRLGSEWLQLIVANRPRYSEDVTTLNDINDIRNGIFSNPTIRQGFDQRDIAILKIPNHILCTEDIPPRHHRALMQPDVTYPRQQRYTLQWLVIPDAVTAMHIPNNSDATFKDQSKPKPSDLLLHYNYGVTAVKCWGRGQNVLREQANPPRPSRPVPASKNKSIRDTTVQKLERARLAGGAGAGSSTAGATNGLVESGGRAEWDEDDIAFLWGNTPAAKERHLKQVGENIRRIEEWREGVPRVSV